ncbi:PhzA/PhzB family protein [Saccharopolyspora taberi]|uniref:Phenazine biosynthesis protein PhzB n=1 Tax=Saccharopolyspora taberi TaxID=60895 RepID=A0ABN3VH34_9PSEU
MTDESARTSAFENDLDLRRRNRETVAKYMEYIKGELRLERYQLFTEDGTAGLYTTDSGEPIVFRGTEQLKAHGEWSLKVLPDWVWTNVQIFETQDPNRFWVECEGEGKILFPGYPEGRYENHFIHSFVLEDGKIKENREFMNPIRQFHALGIEPPRIKRAGIPAD